MLAYIIGTINNLEPTEVVLENSGLGYSLQISLHTYTQIKGQNGLVKLLIYEHIREDQHDLYGFFDAEEKRIFMALIKVQGISTQTARTMLSYHKPEDLAQIIASGDSKTLVAIKGIGRKTAERIILELKEQILKTIGTNKDLDIVNWQNQGRLEQEAIQALQALGITRNIAITALNKVRNLPNPPQKLEAIIVAALQLSR